MSNRTTITKRDTGDENDEKGQVAQLIGCVVGRRRDAERGQVVGRLADEALLHELDHVIKPALERSALRRGVGLLGKYKPLL